jgi:endonuclease YncB( thermonuclease family)
MEPNYTYHAKVVRVVDADTIDVDLDYGDYLHQQRRLRVQGIDAPEKHTEQGKAAIAYVTSVLPVGAKIVVTTFKPDKYGRQLAAIRLPDGSDLSAALLQREMATPYFGGTRDMSTWGTERNVTPL